MQFYPSSIYSYLVMSLPQEVFTQGQDVISHGASLPMVGALTAGGGIFSAVKCVQTMPNGYRGIRTRFGNPSTVEQRDNNDQEVEANLRGLVAPKGRPVFHFPFTHNIERVSIQDRSYDVATAAECEDRKLRDVEGTVIWGVKSDKVSVYRALFKPQGDEKGKPCDANLEAVVEAELAAGYLTVMEAFSVEERGNQENLENALYWLCAGGLAKYGCEVRACKPKKQARSLGQFLLESRNQDITAGSARDVPSSSVKEAAILSKATDIPFRAVS